MSNLLITHGFESNYTVGFAKGLASVGADIVVLSSDEISERLARERIPQRNIRRSQDPGRSAPAKALNLFRYYSALFGAVFDHRGKTVHFTGLLSRGAVLFDGLILATWIRLCAGCYIHTVHNTLPHSREKSRFFRSIYRAFYRFPHVLLVHTPKVGEQLEIEFGVSASRIQCISIGLNEEIPCTSLTPSEARARLKFSEEDRLIVFFGKVEPYKGVDLLAEAWGLVRTPNARLVIVGWCPNEEYAGKIKRCIAASPMSSSIQWREGFLPNEDVESWLKACEGVVMPYRNIYQSGVIFLCLRFGVPIVATKVGSLSEFIDEESGVIARSNDPPGIADAIDRFFSHPGGYARELIAKRAKKFEWDRQCLKIKHLYQ